MQEYQDILYRVQERVATITFNRPKLHNAMSRLLRDETVHALKRAEADDSVSVIVIEGAGRSFCSGYDVAAQSYEGAVHGISPLFDDWTDRLARDILSDWFTIWDLMKPVIAKVHGNCLAGATEVMSMCDVIFVSDNARIGYPATRAQSTPDLAYFAWRMTPARARYLQLSGNIITGKLAADWGWATKSFPEDEFDEAVAREVKALASIEPDMHAANKISLNHMYDIMGMRTGLHTVIPWHYASHKTRPNGGKFRKMANEQGLKVAVEWRDGPFRGIDAPPLPKPKSD